MKVFEPRNRRKKNQLVLGATIIPGCEFVVEPERPTCLNDANELYMQTLGYLDSDFVQVNWGRVQSAVTRDFETVFYGAQRAKHNKIELLNAPHLGKSTQHVSPLSGRQRVLEILEREIKEIIVGVGDVSIGRFALDLQKTPDASTKLSVIRTLIEQLARQVDQKNEITDNVVVLEKLEGFVEQIDEDVAYVTLRSEHGDILLGEYPAAELAAKGIRERRRFKCETIEIDGEVRVSLEAVADDPITPQQEAAIDRETDELLTGDELDGDY